MQYLYRHDEKYLIVNDVPYEQCEYCGEQYFSGKMLKSIEEEFNKIYKHGKKVQDELRVPVEKFQEIEAGL